MGELNVLIVDDDRDFAESLADVMELNGHNVEIVFRGEDAVTIFGERDFDITFMDIRLPGKNGVESFLDIRKIKQDARVVMMTGYSVEQLLAQAVENDAWGVLNKPLKMEKVLEMLDRVKPGGILIADDDPDFIDGIKEVLTGKGYSVFTAGNGREAVERLMANGIDVLILDLRMPVLNGLETIMELKRLGRLIPTIIVTAYMNDEPDTLNTLRSLSVTGILTKPFDPKDLLGALDDILKPG